MTWAVVVLWAIRILFFYCLWRIMQHLSQIIKQGSEATERARRLEDLRAEDWLELKRTTEALLRRQSILVETIEQKTGRIEEKISENTALTIAAAEASATAAEVANHMNEKIVVAHGKVVDTIKDLLPSDKKKKP